MDREQLREHCQALWEWSRRPADRYWLVRFLFLRGLGGIYLIAFILLYHQLLPLLGSEGLTPVGSVLAQGGGFLEQPSLLWLHHSDALMLVLVGTGILISALVMAGLANVPMLALNWAIYLSFVNAGGTWYGWGWEKTLLEAGFLAIFLVPLQDPRPFSRRLPPPRPLIAVLRWFVVRMHLGSGILKAKGDACWETLTCMDTFYAIQPVPNPLSPYMHHLPSTIHQVMTLGNHIVQLVAPLTAVFEERYRRLRYAGGLVLILTQVVLVATGNFSYLNPLTVVILLPFLDDRALSRVLPARLVDAAEQARREADTIGPRRHAVHLIVVALVLVLSVPVLANYAAADQQFTLEDNSWRIVNTYGVFGEVRDDRTELVVQGTTDTDPTNASWRTYDLPSKPDGVDDPLALYDSQPRLNWQFWLRAGGNTTTGWPERLAAGLLREDPMVLELVEQDPFPGTTPRYVRIQAYHLEMRPPGADTVWSRGQTWTWMGPVTLSDDGRLVRADASNQ